MKLNGEKRETKWHDFTNGDETYYAKSTVQSPYVKKREETYYLVSPFLLSQLFVLSFIEIDYSVYYLL